MARPFLTPDPDPQAVLYAFIGRVSLRLVEQNVDAITVVNFLREVAEAGGGALSLHHAREIAQNYVESIQ